MYGTGRVTHVSTRKELAIASTLSSSKAKVFLESRFYIRNALSNFFKLDPLEIPLIANPGEPPTLPKDMGYVSMSHCEDACIVCWHNEKIGIDIESSEREFNFKGLARKYFNKKHINDCMLDKYCILKEWSAIEAAIKWDRGKLSKDLKYWQYKSYEKNLFHVKKNLKVNFNQFSFLKWTISIASLNQIKASTNIICTE